LKIKGKPATSEVTTNCRRFMTKDFQKKITQLQE